MIESILDEVESMPGDYQKLAHNLLTSCPAARDDRVYHRLMGLLHPRPTAITNFAPSVSGADSGADQEAQCRVDLSLAA